MLLLNLRRTPYRSLLAALSLMVAVLFAGACTSTPPTSPTPTPTATAASGGTPTPGTTPTPALPLPLDIMVPGSDTASPGNAATLEAVVGTAGLPIVGITRPDAVVTVNGTLVEVNPDGRFAHSVLLEEGPNLVEVVASDLLGNQRDISLILYYIASTDVPLHVIWPGSDTTVASTTTTVTGASGPDAVVSVNGQVVGVNELGIFSVEVELQEGPNAIEITASTLNGGSRTVTLIVFR